MSTAFSPSINPDSIDAHQESPLAHLTPEQLEQLAGEFDAIKDRVTAELGERWTLLRGRESLLSLPKGAAFRRFLLHHVIHHRGQLTLYLRLLDVKLPPIYGPTADEKL